MTPIEKLGNVNNRKRWSQKIAFGFFTSLSYLVVLILFVILGFIIIKGASVISWDFLRQLSGTFSEILELQQFPFDI